MLKEYCRFLFSIINAKVFSHKRPFFVRILLLGNVMQSVGCAEFGKKKRQMK